MMYVFYMLQIKSKVPHKLNKEEWESQTVKELQKELKKVNTSTHLVVKVKRF